MGIKIRYVLSEKGQKESLLAGGDGRQIQEICCPEELLPDALELASMDPEGNGIVDIGGWVYRETRDGKPIGVFMNSTITDYRVYEETRSFRVQKYLASDEYFRYRVYSLKEMMGPGVWYDEPRFPEDLFEDERKRVELLEAKKSGVRDEVERLNALMIGEKEEARASADVCQASEKERQEEWDREWEIAVAKDKAEVEREHEEREEWVRAHGSERLRAILKEGLLDNSLAVYREERLAIDRPGWTFDPWNNVAEFREVMNPTLEMIEWLRAERKIAADAVLEYAYGGDYNECADYYQDDRGEPVEKIREHVLTAEFMGRLIVRRRDYVA